jgi:hypothetical protein
VGRARHVRRLLLPSQAAQERHLEASRAQGVRGFLEDRPDALQGCVQVAGSGIEAGQLQAGGGAVWEEDLGALPLRAGFPFLSCRRIGEAEVVLGLGIVRDPSLGLGEEPRRFFGPLQREGEASGGLQ